MSTITFCNGSAYGAPNAWLRIVRLGAVLAAHVAVLVWAMNAVVPVRLAPEPLRMDVSLVPYVASAAPPAPAPTPPLLVEVPPPSIPEPAAILPPPVRVSELVAKPKPKPKPKAVETVRQAAMAPQPATDSVSDVAVEPIAAAATSATAPTPTPTSAAPALVEARFDADYLRNPAPVYPPLSRRRGEQGKVLVLVAVTPNGLAGDVTLRESSGYPRLDEAALKAVRGWRFVPARRGDNPVAATVVVPLTFRLE